MNKWAFIGIATLFFLLLVRVVRSFLDIGGSLVVVGVLGMLAATIVLLKR